MTRLKEATEIVTVVGTELGAAGVSPPQPVSAVRHVSRMTRRLGEMCMCVCPTERKVMDTRKRQRDGDGAQHPTGAEAELGARKLILMRRMTQAQVR